MTSDFTDSLRAFAEEFDLQFNKLLTPKGEVPQTLVDAMRHTTLAPGKRLRPYLVARSCELAGGRREDAWAVGAAIESIHAFSLIHDDLPAMDDDDLRRGRLTCHKAFGEAVAILAGDALSVYAFELLAAHTPSPKMAVDLIRELAQATGWSGMIGGQTADILGERESPTLSKASYIHERKTAALIRAACRMGALRGGGDSNLVDRVGAFGSHFGKAFQITDDLLDLTSSTEVMGKRVGKDSTASKQTFPQCVGLEESRAIVLAEVERAVEQLAILGSDADDLRSLARYVTDRNY